jgi:carbamoyl-phosphate synthase large subunit
MFNILITGAGSCMGQSIFKAISFFEDKNLINNVYISNSDELGAAFYFDYPSIKIKEKFIVPLASDVGYLDRIKSIVEEKNIHIIYSGTQHEIFQLSKYKKEFSSVAVLDTNFLEMSLNKLNCFNFLQKYAINIPKTLNLKDYLDHSFYPVILKPNNSSASRNINLIDNETKLKLIENIMDKDNYVIQEYIEGEEYTCGCYIDRFSKEINVIIMKRSLTKDGASGFGEIIESDIIEKYVLEIAQAYIKEGLDFGHLNIQLRMRDDIPYVFEINSRLSSTEAPKAKFGFNSVEAYFYNICLNAPYSKFKKNKNYSKFLRFYEEVYF